MYQLSYFPLLRLYLWWFFFHYNFCHCISLWKYSTSLPHEIHATNILCRKIPVSLSYAIYHADDDCLMIWTFFISFCGCNHGHRCYSQQVVQFSSLEGAAICFCCNLQSVLPLQFTLSDSSSNYRTTCHTCDSESKRMNHKISRTRKTEQFFPC